MPRDRILAAVCHGSVAFVEPRCRNGLPLVEGRRMTVFTDSEEYVIGIEDEVPFMLESTLWKLGAMLKTTEDFGVHVVRYRNLITGHNPAPSAKAR